jgi:hypothetical protein
MMTYQFLVQVLIVELLVLGPIKVDNIRERSVDLFFISLKPCGLCYLFPSLRLDKNLRMESLPMAFGTK